MTSDATQCLVALILKIDDIELCEGTRMIRRGALVVMKRLELMRGAGVINLAHPRKTLVLCVFDVSGGAVFMSSSFWSIIIED